MRRTLRNHTLQIGKVGWKLAVLGIGVAATLYPLSSAHSEEGQVTATIGAPQGGDAENDQPGGGFGNHGPQRHGRQGGGQNGGPGRGGQHQGMNGPDGGGRRGGPRSSPEQMMIGQLDLSAEQQSQAQALFASERAQIEAIRAQTRSKLAALLTDEQRQQFSQMRPQRGGPNGGNEGDRNGGDRNGGDRNGRNGGPGMNGGQMRNNGMQHGGRRNGGIQDEDHGRPVAQIAKELGVTPEQFRAAFQKVHPAGPGERPTQEQRIANRTALSQALGVSPERLDEVMDKYRPGGRGDNGPEQNDDNGPPPREDDDMMDDGPPQHR